MVDCGCFKTKLKKEERRTDEGKTKIRQGSNGDQTKGEGKEKAEK